MTRTRAAVSLVLALSAACSDGATEPQLAASVEIMADQVSFDERTIRVDETVQLTATPRDGGGKGLQDRPVLWTSSAPAVATVSAAGLVRGVAAGTALIVATSDATADTARVNVAAPVSGPVACSAGQAPITLGVGQSYSTTAWDQGTLCLDGGANGAEFVLMPFHASRAAGGKILPVEMVSANAVPISGALASRSAEGEVAEAREIAIHDEEFHLRLRAGTRAELERRMRELPGSEGTGASRALLAAVPQAGDRMRLNVRTTVGGGCSDPIYRTGRVVAVTTRAVVVADTANPTGGFTDDEYRELGEAFDRLVYPLGVESFGAPSDIDKNERALIFFTSAVNDLTQPGSGFYVGGFVYDRDLFPREGRGACVGSNAAEMFYMMVPDPVRQAIEPAFGKERVRSGTLGVVAHEFQHLINASRRLYVSRASTWEDVWLNEGLSHIAEELLFYRVSGLTPRMNEDGNRLLDAASRRAMADFQLSNVERYFRFLRSPHTASATGPDDLATRGAIWSFLRYAADRHGGNQQALWHRLVNSRTAGLANLGEALGHDALPWMHDWMVSLYLDDSGLQTPERFQQPSWNFRALTPRLRGWFPNSGFARYPLRTLGFVDDRLTLELPSGSAGFVRFGVAAQQHAAVRVTSGNLPGPQKLQLTLVRTR